MSKKSNPHKYQRDVPVRNEGAHEEFQSTGYCVFCQNPLPLDRRHELFCIACEGD